MQILNNITSFFFFSCISVLENKYRQHENGWPEIILIFINKFFYGWFEIWVARSILAYGRDRYTNFAGGRSTSTKFTGLSSTWFNWYCSHFNPHLKKKKIAPSIFIFSFFFDKMNILKKNNFVASSMPNGKEMTKKISHPSR